MGLTFARGVSSSSADSAIYFLIAFRQAGDLKVGYIAIFQSVGNGDYLFCDVVVRSRFSILSER